MTRKSDAFERYTDQELDEKRARGESQTDWVRLDTLSERELEAAIDHHEAGEFDWSTVQIGIPGPKQQVTVRLDRDVIEWFKAQGAGYQTRMNAVLKSYVEAQKQREASTARQR